MKIVIRVTSGVGKKPYTYEVSNPNGVIDSRVSSKNEEIFDVGTTINTTGYTYKVTDADGKVVAKQIDYVTRRIQSKLWKGYSISTGEIVDLVNHITQTKATDGLNVAEVPFDSSKYFTLLNADSNSFQGFNNQLWNQQFDHTIDRGNDPLISSFTHPFDKVIYTAYKTGTNADNRTGLKITINPFRIAGTLSNNGYTHSYSENDVRKTVTGKSHNVTMGDNGVMQEASFASDAGLTYVKEVVKKFCTRYRNAINDGTIWGISLGFDSKLNSNYGLMDLDTSGNTLAQGDFSTPIRTKFVEFCKSKFLKTTLAQAVSDFNKQYTTTITDFNLTNFSSNTLLNGSVDLQKLYMWYQMEVMADFETEVFNYSYTQANLFRSKVWVLDIRELFGNNTYRYKTLNVTERLMKSNRWVALRIKNNLNARTPYLIDQILSIGKFTGAVPVYEPTPTTSYAFNETNVTTIANEALTKGVGFSMNRSSSINYQTVITNASFSTRNTWVKADDLDDSGNPIIQTINANDVILDGKSNELSDQLIYATYTNIAALNAGKRINIYVNSDAIKAKWVTTTSTSNIEPQGIRTATESWGPTTYIRSGSIEYGVGYGGSLVGFRSLSGENLINNFDRGRQVQQSYYGAPRPFKPAGYTKHPDPNWNNFPWNPIQTGDVFMNISPILEFQLPSASNNYTYYFKTQPLDWTLNNYPSEAHFESWYSLKEDNLLEVRYKISCHRTDGVTDGAEFHECPAMWLARSLNQAWCTMDGMSKGADPVRLDLSSRWKPDAQHAGVFGADWVMKEPYMCLTKSTDGKGLGWIAKNYTGLGANKNYMFPKIQFWNINGDTTGGATDNATTYFTTQQSAALYGNATLEYSFYLTFGTPLETKSKYQQYGITNWL